MESYASTALLDVAMDQLSAAASSDGGDPLIRLAALSRASEAIDGAIRATVSDARGGRTEWNGRPTTYAVRCTWDEVGKALGLTKQGAQKKYGTG
jgi:hypothetical protein